MAELLTDLGNDMHRIDGKGAAVDNKLIEGNPSICALATHPIG